MAVREARHKAIDLAIRHAKTLEAALADLAAGHSKKVMDRLAQLRSETLDAAPGLPVSEAARILKVSAPTVRAWLGRGLLVQTAGPTRAVSLESVMDLEHRLEIIRGIARNGEVRRDLLSRLDDSETLKDPRVRKSMGQMRRGVSKHYVHRRAT